MPYTSKSRLTAFVAVNCAAIPSTLIESELFGYEGGSFTGAEKQGRPGKLNWPMGAPILDEIGDMPLELQPVLLRVLDEKGLCGWGPANTCRWISGSSPPPTVIYLNWWRVSALDRTSYIVCGITSQYPTLESGADIVLLARYFAQKVAQQQGIAVPQLSDAFLLALLNYEWPGNVRQLENTILYAVNVCHGPMIGRNICRPTFRKAYRRCYSWLAA